MVIGEQVDGWRDMAEHGRDRLVLADIDQLALR